MESKIIIERIHEAKEEELDKIIEEEINRINQNTPKVEQLGFISILNNINIHKGFIPLNTKIKYENFAVETYSMKTTDFFYEYARFVRKYGIKTKSSVIYTLEFFINKYFGYVDPKTPRWWVLQSKAEQAENDDDYFEILDNCEIGDMKGKNCALCTERSAIVQQILSFLGFETYYCIGCVSHNENEEAHCFNIVKRKNDYALLDYSLPVKKYKEDETFEGYYPFSVALTNEEFLEFTETGNIKSFDEYKIVGDNKIPLMKERSYVVGKFSIKEIDNIYK